MSHISTEACSAIMAEPDSERVLLDRSGDVPMGGPDPAERARVEALQEHCCAGAGPFLVIAAVFCTLTLVVPLVVLVANDAPTDALRVVAWLCLAAGGLIFCYGVYPALLPKPEPPAPHGPFHPSRTVAAEMTVDVKKLHVLVNPVGGKKTGKTMLEEKVLPKFREAGIEAVVHETQYAGHAGVLAHELDCAGFDGIVVIGGDGTLHEAVNGMLRRPLESRVPLGIIPGGSGNSVMTDFSSAEGSVTVESAVEAIIGGCAPRVDANKVVYGPDPAVDMVHSINVVGWTADQCMGAINIDGWRSLLGPARYDICAFWGLLKGREASIRVEADGECVAEECSTFFLNQTQHFGKQMRACPNAWWDDGLFDMEWISNKRRGEVVRIFDLIKDGRHCSLVESRQAKNCVLHLEDDEGLFNVDGEVVRYRGGQITIECTPGVFRLFATAPR
jgi:diacylglycerol kinase family enzyme